MSRWASTLCLGAALHAAVLTTAAPLFAQAPPATSGSSAPAAPVSVADVLKLAQQQYDDTKYDESIQTLAGVVLRADATREQKIEIYKMLFYDEVALNKMAAAESYARQLFIVDPTYELPATESPRFRTPFAEFKRKWEAEGRPGIAKPQEAAPAPVTMIHSSLSQVDPSTQVDLTVRLRDAQHRTAAVHLYYRASGDLSFTESNAVLDPGGSAHASIPPSAVKPPFIEYYFEAVDGKGRVVATKGEATTPLRIAVPEPSKGGGWVLPVIGGGLLGAAAIVGGLALAGVFKSSGGGGKSSTVSISVGE